MTIHHPTRREFLALGATATLGLTAQQVLANTPAHYPKSLKIIVPYSAGGGTDIIARHLAERLRQKTGVSAIVDNKPGANGVIGTDLVAKSAPDGGTLVLVVNSHLLNPVVMSKLPYDTFKDLKGVTQVAVSPLVLVTGIKNEGANAREFLAAVRKNKPVKVLGNGDISVAVQVSVDAASATAKSKIEAAGGSVTTA